MSDVRTVAADSDLLALVLGPDGGAAMLRDDLAEDGWVALWNGDDAHDPKATGMLSGIVATLAAGQLPVWTAASYDGDFVLVPADRLEEAVGVLRRAGAEHTLAMFKLRGGGDATAAMSRAGVPAARLVILPTTHLGTFWESAVLVPMVSASLDDVTPTTPDLF